MWRAASACRRLRWRGSSGPGPTRGSRRSCSRGPCPWASPSSPARPCPASARSTWAAATSTAMRPGRCLRSPMWRCARCACRTCTRASLASCASYARSSAPSTSSSTPLWAAASPASTCPRPSLRALTCAGTRWPACARPRPSRASARCSSTAAHGCPRGSSRASSPTPRPSRSSPSPSATSSAAKGRRPPGSSSACSPPTLTSSSPSDAPWWARVGGDRSDEACAALASPMRFAWHRGAIPVGAWHATWRACGLSAGTSWASQIVARGCGPRSRTRAQLSRSATPLRLKVRDESCYDSNG
mmetsp:Transcript_15012/g.50658  ORF Transcript_15012/g.50658 Transcript_15012/m.50658 type:complete len:301 (-) Transcript_15012:8-910(-)